MLSGDLVLGRNQRYKVNKHHNHNKHTYLYTHPQGKPHHIAAKTNKKQRRHTTNKTGNSLTTAKQQPNNTRRTMPHPEREATPTHPRPKREIPRLFQNGKRETGTGNFSFQKHTRYCLQCAVCRDLIAYLIYTLCTLYTLWIYI